VLAEKWEGSAERSQRHQCAAMGIHFTDPLFTPPDKRRISTASSI
jgi:hypothetical protein